MDYPHTQNGHLSGHQLGNPVPSLLVQKLGRRRSLLQPRPLSLTALCQLGGSPPPSIKSTGLGRGGRSGRVPSPGPGPDVPAEGTGRPEEDKIENKAGGQAPVASRVDGSAQEPRSGGKGHAPDAARSQAPRERRRETRTWRRGPVPGGRNEDN